MKIIVKVTETDIKNGIKNDICNCPVAKALGSIPGVSQPQVGISIWFWYNQGGYVKNVRVGIE